MEALLLPVSGGSAGHVSRSLAPPPLTAEGLLDLNMPRAGTEACDKFSAKYGLLVGVVIFDDVFVPHDRASRRVELSIRHGHRIYDRRVAHQPDFPLPR
jgi:hypothetical protein